MKNFLFHSSLLFSTEYFPLEPKKEIDENFFFIYILCHSNIVEKNLFTLHNFFLHSLFLPYIHTRIHKLDSERRPLSIKCENKWQKRDFQHHVTMTD